MKTESVLFRQFLLRSPLALESLTHWVKSRHDCAHQNESKQHDINLWVEETKPFSLELFLIEEIELRKCTVKINCLFLDCPAHQLILQTRWCFKRFRFSLLLVPRSCLTAQRFLSQFEWNWKVMKAEICFHAFHANRNVVEQSAAFRKFDKHRSEGMCLRKSRFDALIRRSSRQKRKMLTNN